MDRKPTSEFNKQASVEVSENFSEAGTPKNQAEHDFSQVVNCASRDIYCFFIFIALTVFSILVSIYCLNWGDPHRLTRGWDFRAQLCGVDDLEDKPYVYFPDPQESTDIRLCMAGCPAFESELTVCFYETDHTTPIEGIECYDAKPAKPYYNRYCLPTDEEDRDEVLEVLDDGMIRLSLWAGDVSRIWDVLGVGGLISFGTVLIIVTWISIGFFIEAEVIIVGIGATGLTVLLGYLMYREGYRLENDLCDDFDPVEMNDCDYDGAINAHIVLSSFIYLGALVILLSLALSFRKMRRGVSIIRLSWQPVGTVWTILLIPLFLTFLAVGVSVLCLYTIIYGLSIASIEEVDADVPGGEVKILDFDKYEKILLIYEILVYLWVINFLSQISYYTAAALQIQWYFHRDQLQFFTLKVLRHALSSVGSIALGSFFIPMTQLLKIAFPCYFLFRKKSVIRTITHSAYSFQIAAGIGFFNSGKRVRELLDSSKGNTLDGVVGCRFVHWINSILVIVIAPIYVAYWLKYQDDTPSGEEEIKRITSYSMMCVVMIFPAWAISRIWYMFAHGLSNSVSIALLYELRTGLNQVKEDDDLKKQLYSILKPTISPAHSGELEVFNLKIKGKPKLEEQEIRTDTVNQHVDEDIEQENFNRVHTRENEFGSGAGVIRPVSQSGGRPQSTAAIGQFQSMNPPQNISSDRAFESHIPNQTGILIEEEITHRPPDAHLLPTIVQKQHESSEETPGQYDEPMHHDPIQPDTKALESLRENAGKHKSELENGLGSIDQMQRAYMDSQRSIAPSGPPQIQEEALKEEELEDLEGDYEHPSNPEGEVPHVLNPNNSSDKLNLLY